MTREQEAILARYAQPAVASKEQTREQAENLAMRDLRYIFSLEGVEPPAEEDLRAALRNPPAGGT